MKHSCENFLFLKGMSWQGLGQPHCTIKPIKLIHQALFDILESKMSPTNKLQI